MTQNTSTLDMGLPGIAAPASANMRIWIAVAASMLGAYMAILDIQITSASLKEILGSLSATQEEGSWISTAYLATEVVVIPLTVLFSRAFGERTYLLASTLLFMLSSVLCANAWSLSSMIAFRMLQGFTGGAFIPMCMTLILTKLPPKQRPIGLALFALSTNLAPTTGPTAGGYLTEWYGWPAIFNINWIPGILLLAGIAYGLDREPKKIDVLRNADWLGIGCMALWLGAMTVFLEEGNTRDWFESTLIVSCAALTVIGFFGWVAASVLRKNSFVNLGLYGQRNFLIATLISMVVGMALYGSAFILPLFLAQIPGYNPIQIGKTIMWMGLPQLLVMPIAAILSAKVDNRIICSIGLALFGASCLMNVFIDSSTGYDQLFWSQIVRALGQPFIMVTVLNFATNGIAPQDLPSASGLVNMTRNLGASVGIALLATTLTNREKFHSLHIGQAVSSYSAQTQERLEQLTQSFISSGASLASATDQAVKVLDNIVRRESYVMAYSDCFWFIGATLLICIPFVWLSDRVVSNHGGEK
ncbi:MAG: DHA2 family efflux MFS transporter permease subunit [Pseudomonadota bacterium]